MGKLNRTAGIAIIFLVLSTLLYTSCDEVGIKIAARELVAAFEDLPVPGGSGTLAANTVTATGFTLSWTAATDDDTAQNQLRYKVVRSLSNNISTAATAEANGTECMPWTANTTTTNITGLTAGTKYFVTVLVQDASGTKEVYTTREGPSNIRVHIGVTDYDNTHGYDFGYVTGTPKNTTFTIDNTGFGRLFFSNPAPDFITVTGATSVYSIPPPQPVDAIEPSTTRTFIARFVTDYSHAIREGSCNIPNNDPDNGFFSFQMTGTAGC